MTKNKNKLEKDEQEQESELQRYPLIFKKTRMNSLTWNKVTPIKSKYLSKAQHPELTLFHTLT